MLKKIMTGQLQNIGGYESVEEFDFPMKTEEDVQRVDILLKDKKKAKAVVSTTWSDTCT